MVRALDVVQAGLVIVAVLSLCAPLAWVLYLAFFDPLAPVNVLGKPMPAGALVGWTP